MIKERPRGAQDRTLTGDDFIAHDKEKDVEAWEGIFLRGVILPGQERVELKEFDRPEPGHGQVLVKMKASGLCGSDLRTIYHEHTGGALPERHRGPRTIRTGRGHREPVKKSCSGLLLGGHTGYDV